MKKKFCIILVVLFCALAFVGCNSNMQRLKDKLKEKPLIIGDTLMASSLDLYNVRIFGGDFDGWYCSFHKGELEPYDFEIPNKKSDINYIYRADEKSVFGGVIGLIGVEYYPKKNRLIVYHMTPDCYKVVITQDESYRGVVYYTIKEKKYEKEVLTHVFYGRNNDGSADFVMEEKYFYKWSKLPKEYQR